MGFTDQFAKKNIELLERYEDEVERRLMVQHLWNNIVESTQSKQKDPLTGRRINPVLLELVKAMQGVWDQESPLKKEGLVSAAVEAHEASKKEEPDGSRKL